MADDPRYRDSRPPTRPRWVMVLLIIAVVLIVLVVVIAITGGEHGPGRHLPEGDNPRGHTTPVQNNL
jgi:hypothetical protein